MGAMPSRLWSCSLEGDDGDLLVGRDGRVYVSTTRHRQEARSGGLFGNTSANDTSAGNTSAGNTSADDASAEDRSVRVCWGNHYANRCYALEPTGAIAWTAEAVYAKSEAPDGSLLVANDRHELLVLDRDGRERDRRWVGDRDRSHGWSVIGWRGAQPIFAVHIGSCWVEPFIFGITRYQLDRFNGAGELLERIPLSMEPFDAYFRQRPDLELVGRVMFPRSLDVHYHPGRHRLIANRWARMAWTMSLRLDGSLEWLTLPTIGCCNFLCLVGDDVIVHSSACGDRVSFLTAADGVVFREHDLKAPHRGFALDGRGVCVPGKDALHAFDERGEPAWKLEMAGFPNAAAHDGVLYTLARGDHGLQLSAFDLG